MGKRGPQSLGNTTSIKVSVPPEIDAALSRLVNLSGVSKAAIVREALALHLSRIGMLPETANDVIPTPTRGPDLAINR
jgi:hypothetical protein